MAGGDGAITLEAKVVDILVALAAQPGAVLSRDELIEAVWKTEFGADERLTRAISILRKAFHDERGTTYIETVSKRGYRLVAAVEPMAATNGALAGEATESAWPAPAREVARPPPSRPWRAWQAYAAAGAVAALVVAGVAATVWRDPDSSASIRTQDVVELRPFFVIDGKPEKDDFARQAHASVKRILASNQVSLVDGSAAQVAARRGPEFTLSGLVEQVDDRYSVTLFFDNRRDGQTLWSHRFTRAVADGQGLREEIGANAAYVIRCALKQRAAAPVTPAVEVFKAYLETCDPQQILDGGPELLVIAQRLTQLAPDDPYGHGLLALANANSSGVSGLTAAQSDSYRTAARRSAARARELDSRNAFAPLAEAWLAPAAESWRLQDSYVKNWGLGHPVAVYSYMSGLRTTGRLKEAVHVLNRGVAEIPLSPKLKTSQAVLMMAIGDHEGADRLFEETSRLWPDFEVVHWYRFVNAAFYGDRDHALKLLNTFEHDKQHEICYRTFIEARGHGGNTTHLAAVRKACVRAERSHHDYAARMLAALGDTDGAYDVMKDASFDWDGSTTFLFYPEMKQFRRDGRFMSFIADSGLVEYWIASNQWPDFCSDKEQPYNCKAAATRAIEDKSPRGGRTASQD